MTLGSFEQRMSAIRSTPLPDVSTLFAEASQTAQQVSIGRTSAFDRWGVSSEAEFKRQCISEGRITYHAHIGMGNWDLTTQALEYLWREGGNTGAEVHRAGLCLDRRMGLPEPIRANAAAETGPMLDSTSDWRQIGQKTPIQPHMGDFMIGFPSSFANTVHALRAGVTTIGNLSQFFSHEAPGWTDPIATAVETTKAIALLAQFRNQGVMLHSYLEDGFGALFFDCTTIAGWALLERYIVEDLMGAKLSHCIGGLTSDPVKRAGWVFALDRIHQGDCLGSMFYGDTISFTRNFNQNRAMVAEYMLWDIMAQLACPTGHAVLPLPVTEAIRAPSAQEILEAQVMGQRVEETARRLLPRMDFSDSHQFADQMLEHGQQVFDNALSGLAQAGVDIRNPLELLYTLKLLGPAAFEEQFGAGVSDSGEARGRKIIVPTDIFQQSIAKYQDSLTSFQDPKLMARLKGKRLLLASGDVHEHAIIVLNWLLAHSQAEVSYLGAEASPEAVAGAAHDMDAILVSTHNGMALEYGEQLQAALKERSLEMPVLFGGVLNQKVADQDIPVDVTKALQNIGIQSATSDAGSRLGRFLEHKNQT
jgi:methylmalonyl-CoA mutase cobalamin-binding subunit